jgi:sphingomyelin phosphodiesterase acid-like 3
MFSFIMFVYLLIAGQSVFATNFLSIADLHFNPFASCDAVIPCPLIEKLRVTPAEQWKELLATADTQPPQFKQDTNYSLLKSALGELRNVAETENPRFALVLGDFLAHGFKEKYLKYANDKTPEAYQAFVKKTMEFLTSEIQLTFPKLDVYAAVGNNDSYQDNYATVPRGAFFKDMANIWSELIRDRDSKVAMQQAFPQGGYYAVDVSKEENIRLIVLNSVLFSPITPGPDIKAAAQQELEWLHNELVSVNAKHQKAIIALHISVGADVFKALKKPPFTLVELWQPEFTQRFQAELQQYSADIMAVLPAHFHMDWFQMLAHDVPISGTPAISPIYGNNPSFKLYSYSKQSRQLKNFKTYFYSLNTTQQWSVEYDFNAIYQPHCQHCQISDGMKLIKPVGDLTDRYKFYFSVETNSQPITTQWLPYYWCAIRGISAADYETCIRSS